MSDDEKLWAYLDGELDSVQSEVIERELERDAVLRTQAALNMQLRDSVRVALLKRSSEHQVKIWDQVAERIQQKSRSRRVSSFVDGIREFAQSFILTPQFGLGLACGLGVLSISQFASSVSNASQVSNVSQANIANQQISIAQDGSGNDKGEVLASSSQPAKASSVTGGDIKFVSNSPSSLRGSAVPVTRYAEPTQEQVPNPGGSSNLVRLPDGRIARTMSAGYVFVPKGTLPTNVADGKIQWLRSQKRVRILAPKDGASSSAPPVIWVSRK